MKLLTSSLAQTLLLFLSATSFTPVASASDSSDTHISCVARSPTTGLYYDLNAISLTPPESKDGAKIHKGDRDESWQARGHDYGTNFTINICSPVIEDVEDVEGVEKSRWKNVSAFYEKSGKVYSIGCVLRRITITNVFENTNKIWHRQQASDPFFRGRKLVLNYTDGSPCPAASSDRYSNPRTKSTIMSFLCDRDAHAYQTAASFVGTMDECTYFFEVRSSVACGGMAPGPDGQGLGPGGVFGVICLIAVAVYLIGGCAYQRTVMHQRGWRQCPNFSLWAGIFDFGKDMAIILFSSLGRLFHCKRPSLGSGRYSNLNTSSDGRRGRHVDEENRLIDQLDEEWDG